MRLELKIHANHTQTQIYGGVSGRAARAFDRGIEIEHGRVWPGLCVLYEKECARWIATEPDKILWLRLNLPDNPITILEDSP